MDNQVDTSDTSSSNPINNESTEQDKHSKVSDGLQNFLLEEYKTKLQTSNAMMQFQETRLNIFTVIITGTIVGLGTIPFIPDLFSKFPIVGPAWAITGILTIYLIGIITYVRMIQRSLEATVLNNQAHKIKEYLVKTVYFIEEKGELHKAIFSLNAYNRFLSTGILRGRWGYLMSLPMIVAILNTALLVVGCSAIERARININPMAAQNINLTMEGTTFNFTINNKGQQELTIEGLSHNIPLTPTQENSLYIAIAIPLVSSIIIHGICFYCQIKDARGKFKDIDLDTDKDQPPTNQPDT